MHPKQILSEMINDFKSASSSLIEIKHEYFEEIRSENAIYGIAFGKPTKRLSALLNIDRELLIVFTSFASQQARTVKTITKALADNKGRLESSVSIVLHPDPRGNVNLKAWGRENNISVLPIYYEKEQYPMSTEKFENILCREIFSIDPFNITGPVSEDAQFYGRRNEALTIARQLQNGQIKAILGIRKIGKTSIINRVVDILNSQYDCYVIMIDCSKDEIWSQSAASLLYSVSKTIDEVVETNRKYSMLLPEEYSGEISGCTALFSAHAKKYDKPVIIVFDEIDYITPTSPTGNHWVAEFNTFWRNFRSIYQESLRIKKPISVIISGVSSKWFRVESINGIENAALAMVPEDYLGPLPHQASVAMIRTLGRIVGLSFADNVAGIISEMCCESPYWIRKACSYIHRRIEIQSRPLTIDCASVQEFLQEFINDEGAIISKFALEHLFRVYPELKDQCAKIHNGQVNSVSKSYINILLRYGILKEASFQSYTVSGDMIKEALNIIFSEITSDNSKSSATEPIEIKSDFEEWADELALINRRRNILERKLRGIVLNFIRQDTLTNKNKPKIKDRILYQVSEQRRKQIEHHSPEEIMDKLLWLELYQTIIKEWTLFERIFSDKRLFELNASLINDRIDAHAKAFDSADIALYRRAFTWFENCINPI